MKSDIYFCPVGIFITDIPDAFTTGSWCVDIADPANLVSCMVGDIFQIYAVNKTHRKAILFFKYLLRVKRSENFIAKYTQPLKYIASSYPVKDIHEGGLIEYYGPTTPWGVLLEVDPFRVGDDELEAHQAQLVEVFDSLPETIKFSVINTSYVDESEHIISTIRDRANDPHLSLPQKE